MVDIDEPRGKRTGGLICLGSVAQDLFGAMEFASDQRIEPGVISRTSLPGFSCQRTKHDAYICVVQIHADTAFLDAMR
jgi:hypothetical protein